MVDVGNSSQCWDLIKCPYFADTTERGDKGWNEAQRQGEDRVTLWITGTNFNSSYAGNIGYPAKLNGSAIAHVSSQK
jgi:hypothetical protein